MAETPSVLDRLEREPGIIVPPSTGEFLHSLEPDGSGGIASWLSPDVARRDGSAIQGVGLFAERDIPAGMLVAIKAGRVLDAFTVNHLSQFIEGSHQQIGPDRFLAGGTSEEVDQNLVGYNHSCDPNAGVRLLEGVPLAFVTAGRDIGAGDELTADYSVSQMTNTHFMICDCGSPDCRRIIAPLWDWEDHAFQAAHEGEFPRYIQDAIDEDGRLNATAESDQQKFHTTLKLAGGLRLLDGEIQLLNGEREGHIAGIQEEWVGGILKEWQQTPPARKLEHYEELRLKTAAQFVRLSPLLGPADIGLEAHDFLPSTAIDHGEAMRTMRERIGPHISEITGVAEELAREFSRFFEQ